jgi:tetratricopeptide (TPR) repeat protein
MKKYLTWTNFVKLVCSVLAVILLVALIIKLVNPEAYPNISFETLLIALAICILVPYISQLEAFGVKLEIKKQVDDMSANLKALPDYMLGSEYHTDGDYEMAEQAYRKSLDQCGTFWPAILGLGGVYHDREEFDRAIMEYKRVLEIDKNNVYALNNMADVYAIADPPLRDAQKALDAANQALQIIPTKASTLHYKAVALNQLGRYAEAHTILNGLISKGMLSDQRHWVMYELAIANSRLGTPPTLDYFEKILLHAREHGAASHLMTTLSFDEELERFSVSDRPMVKRFLKKNAAYLKSDIL